MKVWFKKRLHFYIILADLLAIAQIKIIKLNIIKISIEFERFYMEGIYSTQGNGAKKVCPDLAGFLS